MADQSDWLKVVYGSGLHPAGGRQRVSPTGITVRQTPSRIDLSGEGVERRVRVTVVPSEPGLSWRLYLRDFSRGPAEGTTRRIWWRLEPGTWQPLGGTRQCVAEGRGRVRLDVALRLEESGGDEGASGSGDAPSPALRFVAESD